jgi:hypothetical protein
MKLINKLKIAAIALLGLAAYQQAAAYEDGDNQLWLKASAKLKIADNTTMIIEEEMKYGDDMSELYDKETLLLLSHSVADNVSIAYGYRCVHELGSSWVQEDRPTFDVIFKQKASGWKLEERVRWEYRMKEGKSNYSRFRFRIKAKSPWKWTSAGINPYFAYETNYSDKDHDAGFDRHRLYAGITWKIAEHVSGDLYFCRQRDDKGDYWRDYNALGAAVGFKF